MGQVDLNLLKYNMANMEEISRQEGEEVKLSFSLEMLSLRYPKTTKKKGQISSWTQEFLTQSRRSDC